MRAGYFSHKNSFEEQHNSLCVESIIANLFYFLHFEEVVELIFVGLLSKHDFRELIGDALRLPNRSKRPKATLHYVDLVRQWLNKRP